MFVTEMLEHGGRRQSTMFLYPDYFQNTRTRNQDSVQQWRRAANTQAHAQSTKRIYVNTAIPHARMTRNSRWSLTSGTWPGIGRRTFHRTDIRSHTGSAYVCSCRATTCRPGLTPAVPCHAAVSAASVAPAAF